MAITVSMGALGATLAYFGYNNYISKTDKENVGVIGGGDQLTSRSDIPSPRNKIVGVYDSTEACLQTKSGGEKKSVPAKPVAESAKKEVAKAVENEWGQFWQSEYETQRGTNQEEVHADDFH